MNDQVTETEGEHAAVGWTEAELDLTTLDDDLLPEGHRSGFVAVVGRPNVGKSTLMNAYLGQKVAIVSPKPQTTRLRQLGILTTPEYQVVFVDTPGWHEPRHKLGEYMIEAAVQAIAGADLILFLLDLSEPITVEDRLLAESVRGKSPVVIGMNKVDLLEPHEVDPCAATFCELLPSAAWITLSAVHGDNRDALLEMIVENLPLGPRYYPADQVTDARVRDLAGELIREQCLTMLRDEVPHSVAVVVQEFKERSDSLVYIGANVFVEKDSQKGILIGSRGAMLKSNGAAARHEIEEVLGVRVYLDLWVKVRPKWRRSERELQRLGYSLRK